MEQFKLRIQKRAEAKIQEALKEQEEEERKARLGPGGLDPVEVYAELPDVCSNIKSITDQFYTCYYPYVSKSKPRATIVTTY